MHENSGNSVIYYAHYTEGGVNKTGLTVTITVYEVIRDGTKTEVVTNGACTEIGDGLYRYLLASSTVDAAAEYVAVFHTATDTVDAQDIPAMWVIDRAGTEKLDTGVPVGSIAPDAITALATGVWTDTDVYGADEKGFLLQTLYDDLVNGGRLDLLIDSIIAHLVGIKGSGWTDETMVALMTAIEAIPTAPLLASGYTAPDNAGIAAIKAKTDNLPADPADDSDIDAQLAAIKAETALIVEDTGTTIPATLANLALEATLTAMKGTGWTDETLVALMTAIEAVTGGSGATAQEVWEYATRTLTAGTNIDLSSLATATNLAAVKSDTAAILADTGTDGVKINATQGAITWGQQKIVADVANEGALDISNSNLTGYGQSNYGKRYGLVNTGENLAGQKNDGGMKAVDGFDPALALESTLTAIKGAGWTDETLVALMTAIEAVTGGSGATAQEVWEYTTRTLTAGTNIDLSSLATAADLATLDDKADAIKAKTDNLPADPADDSDIDTAIAAVKSVVDAILVDTGTTLDTKLNTIDTNVDSILADTNEVQAELADGGRTDLLIDAIKAKSDLIPASPAEAGEYTAAIAAIPTAPLLAANYTAPDNTSIAAIKEKTDNLPASPAPANEYDTELTAIQTDLDNPDQYKADVSSLAKATDLQDVENKIDAVDAKVSAIDTDTVMSFMIDGFTFEEIVQIMASVLAGKLTRSGDTLTFRDLADTVNRVVAETDANKQRTDMTYTV